jgi:lipopolysaccharide/colanic/teichoic acid biosynthesis glycosyltransferase
MTVHSEVLRSGPSVPERMVGKRVVDVLASAIGLSLFIPLFAFIAVAIWLEDGGPPFYRQTRIGRAGRPFEIDKFRSMTPAPMGSGLGLTVAGDPRVTRVGAFLRRSKLDELPQLFNVLVGEMSLVGPRPETPELIRLYTPSQRAVMLSVRPGMTDYASVLLRDESALLARARDPVRFYQDHLMPLKYELCLRYINETGPLMDVRVVLATFWSVLFPSARNPLIDRTISNRLENAAPIGIDDGA